MEQTLASSFSPYIPGKTVPEGYPLNRYLPGLPGGMVSTWLAERKLANHWILDPFGSSFQLLAEGISEDCKFLVTANNPLLQLILRVCSEGSRASDFQQDLDLLFNTRKGSETLGEHIRMLYQTPCGNCGSRIDCESFIWQKGDLYPSMREYLCPICGDGGERSFTDDDRRVLDTLSRSNLHTARALEKIASKGDPLRTHAEDTLTCFLPRALYVFMTLLNKLEGLSISDEQQARVRALLLTCFDRGTTLWPVDSPFHHPRQTITPPRFREFNLWLALQRSVSIWSNAGKKIPFSLYPDLPAGNAGICVFPGRVRDLPAHLEISLDSALAILPRPNQAFWAFSAVWTAWLLGKAAIEPIRSVLLRQRYDWNWHTDALRQTFSAIKTRLSPQTSFFALIPELEPSFLTAALLAGNQAGLQVIGIAARNEDHIAQILWMLGEDRSFRTKLPTEEILPAIRQIIRWKGEVVNYLELSSAIALNLIEQGPLQDSIPHGELQAEIRKTLGLPGLYQTFGSGESGLWWLRDFPPGIQPLMDRVEIAVWKVLIQSGTVPFSQVQSEILSTEPGLCAPGQELISTILESYAAQAGPGKAWQLKDSELPEQRDQDISRIKQALLSIAQKLDYRTVEDGKKTTWSDEGNRPVFSFIIQANAVIDRNQFNSIPAAGQRVLILPGSRINLLEYKRRHDPVLDQSVLDGWRIIKFRHVLGLADNPMLTRETWMLQMDNDPPEYQPIQMEML